MIQALLRFSLVGLLNTLLGYAIILAGLATGLGDYPSNLLGYAGGLAFSFFAHRSWTFRSGNGASWAQASDFVLAFLIAYGANLLVIGSARWMGFIDNPLTHLFAMASYSAVFFLLSSTLVFDSRRSGLLSGTIGRFVQSHYPELSLVLAALLCWVAIRATPITHDVVWQYWIARQMLGGASLYKDIWELNPPLWFWSAVPVQWMAEALHVQPLRLMIPVIIALGTVSALLFGMLGTWQSPARRCAMMLMAFAVMVPMPLYDFGQREQLALIGALPYAALIARRRLGLAVPLTIAILVGLFAAYAFALKHYFLTIPVLLEAWLVLGLRRHWRPIRAETLTLGLAALLYAVCVLLFARDFLTQMVPMVGIAYHGYQIPFIDVCLRAFPILWMTFLLPLAFYALTRRIAIEPILATVLLTALGFAFAYFVQQKGWLYHSIPVTGALLLALGLAVSVNGLRRMLDYPLAMLALTLGLCFCFSIGPYRNFLEDRINAVLDTVPAGEPVLAVATDPMWTWPELEQRGLTYPSSLYSYWMLPAIGQWEKDGRGGPQLRAMADQVLERSARDLRCNPPALIVIERRRTNIQQPSDFNVQRFFMQNPDIRGFMASHYRAEAPTDYLHIYRRIGTVPKSREAGCRVLR